MSSNATYTFKLNTAAIKQVEKNAILGLTNMAYAINNRAKGKAPYLTGTLVDSIRVDESGKSSGVLLVRAGGTSSGYNVPYALMREFVNNKHPNTTRYMSSSFEDVTKDYISYFKGITK